MWSPSPFTGMSSDTMAFAVRGADEAVGARVRSAPGRPGTRATVVVLLIWLALGATAAAQATPTPDVPPATLCTVPVPSLSDLNGVILAVAASPAPTPTPGVTPKGVPADAETVDAITAVVRELVGCYNAGELLRSYALYTDAYLRRLFSRQGGFPQTTYDSFATPQPADDPVTNTAILDITDVRLLPDGSVGATVTLRYASIPMPKTFYFTFVRVEGRWLIDGILGEISFSVP